MLKISNLRRVMVMAALCLMLLAVPLATYAQENTAAAASAPAVEEQPRGVGTGVLLVGLLVVVAVGGIWLIRERTEAPSKE